MAGWGIQGPDQVPLPGRRCSRPKASSLPVMERSWAAAVGTAARLLLSTVPAPRPDSPSPPVPLTPTLPNPICKLAARRPRPGPHPRSPNSRRGSTGSSLAAVYGSPGAGSGWRGLKKPGVGRRPQSEPCSSPLRSGTLFPSSNSLPPTRLYRSRCILRSMGENPNLFVCLSFLVVGKGRRFLRDSHCAPHDPSPHLQAHPRHTISLRSPLSCGPNGRENLGRPCCPPRKGVGSQE